MTDFIIEILTIKFVLMISCLNYYFVLFKFNTNEFMIVPKQIERIDKLVFVNQMNVTRFQCHPGKYLLKETISY